LIDSADRRDVADSAGDMGIEVKPGQEAGCDDGMLRQAVRKGLLAVTQKPRILWGEKGRY